MSAVVETHNLTKRYHDKLAVNTLNLVVQEGEIFGFLGPNGAGKTTTILMLLGLTEPTSGRASVCGFDPTHEPLEVKRRVGYLPENPGFYEDLSARENLLYMARLNRIPEDEASRRTSEVLEQVGLSEDGRRLVREYSRGMKQRLGIAEVLVKNPSAVILDEPTLGIDPDGAIQVLELIKGLNREHRLTVMLSSHQLQQVQQICNRVGIIVKGRLVVQGEMDELGQQFSRDASGIFCWTWAVAPTVSKTTYARSTELMKSRSAPMACFSVAPGTFVPTSYHWSRAKTCRFCSFVPRIRPWRKFT